MAWLNEFQLLSKKVEGRRDRCLWGSAWVMNILFTFFSTFFYVCFPDCTTPAETVTKIRDFKPATPSPRAILTKNWGFEVIYSVRGTPARLQIMGDYTHVISRYPCRHSRCLPLFPLNFRTSETRLWALEPWVPGRAPWVFSLPQNPLLNAALGRFPLAVDHITLARPVGLKLGRLPSAMGFITFLSAHGRLSFALGRLLLALGFFSHKPL